MHASAVKFIVAGSLALNVILLAGLVANRRIPSAASTPPASSPTPGDRAVLSKEPKAAPQADFVALNWSSDWNGANLRELVLDLEKRQVPNRVIRAIVTSLLDQKFDAALARALASSKGSGGLYFTGRLSPLARLEQNLILTAKERLLKEALGEFYSAESDTERATRLRIFGNISVEKASAIAEISNQIEQVKLTLLGEGTSPNDLSPLEAEKLARIEKILTPAEFQEYCLNQTTAGMKTKSALLGIEVTRDELMGILALQANRYAESPADQTRSPTAYFREQAETYRSMASLLGPDRYVQFLKNEGREFKHLADQVFNQGPSLNSAKLTEIWDYHLSTTWRVAEARETFAQNPERLAASLNTLYAESAQRGKVIMGEAAWQRYATWPGAGWVRLVRPAAPR
ncbi:MAG: hypothetical protein U1F61_22685 [Opitutaceae bacterium]